MSIDDTAVLQDKVYRPLAAGTAGPGEGRSLVNSTVLMKGHVIAGGARFLWWIVQGHSSRLTVSHPVYGTKTAPLHGDAGTAAKQLARSLMAEPAAS